MMELKRYVNQNVEAGDLGIHKVSISDVPCTGNVFAAVFKGVVSLPSYTSRGTSVIQQRDLGKSSK
jgi:hypothetical protein